MYITEVRMLFSSAFWDTGLSLGELSELTGIEYARLGRILNCSAEKPAYPTPEECDAICKLFPRMDYGLIMEAAYKYWEKKSALAEVYSTGRTEGAQATKIPPVRRHRGITPELKIPAIMWWGKSMGLPDNYGKISVEFDKLNPLEKKAVYDAYLDEKYKSDQARQSAAELRRQKRRKAEEENPLLGVTSWREQMLERSWGI